MTVSLRTRRILGSKLDDRRSRLLGIDPDAMPATAGDVLPSSVAGPMAIVGGAYEGASRTNSEIALWQPSMNSADSDLLPEKGIMDARVRDTVRNDAYSASGAQVRKDSIVGAMFALNAKPNWRVLGLDQKWAEEFQEEVENKFTLWAESPSNYVDASRINNFTGLVRLAVGMDGMAGEILGVGKWKKNRSPFRTCVLMVDPDRLSTPYYERPDADIRGGVERDPDGAPLAYHIRKAHPTDFLREGVFEWARIPKFTPWGRQNVIHIYQQMRPDQSRGVARMVAALKASRITSKFRDITLQNAVVQATYAASIESEMSPEVIFQMLGGGNLDSGKVADAINAFAGGYMNVLSEFASNSRNLHIDGVKIPHLMPGSKLQLRPAGKGGALGTDFERSLLRYIAAILGVSYEQLSRDYSQTNYSSARAAMTETWKGMQADKKMTADRFASSVYMLWLEEAIVNGEITALPRRAPNFWEGLNKEAYSECEWIGASRGQIDELKETQAAVLRLKYGLSTFEEEQAKLGKDFRKVFDQMAREKKLMESLGINIVLGNAEDNMMNAVSGSPRTGEAKGEKEDGSEDNTDV